MGRLKPQNLDAYLEETYGKSFVQEDIKILPIRGLQQQDYGEAYDCTLTSITTIVAFYLGYKVPFQEIYDYTEAVAKRFFYSGSKTGTPFNFIKVIFESVLRKYGLPSKTKQVYLKWCLGYNFNTIKNQIDAGRPVMLSMLDDGRDYYTNHTVTIMGYRVMRAGETTVPILCVLDNWTKLISYIDFNKLSTISSLNY